jgi:hypothetical protein
MQRAKSVPEFARLFAGGDWIRTSSARAREVGCRAPTAAKSNDSTKPLSMGMGPRAFEAANRHGGTKGSNPVPSSGESGANLTGGGAVLADHRSLPAMSGIDTPKLFGNGSYYRRVVIRGHRSINPSMLECRSEILANAAPRRASNWLCAERLGLRKSHSGTHALSSVR